MKVGVVIAALGAAFALAHQRTPFYDFDGPDGPYHRVSPLLFNSFGEPIKARPAPVRAPPVAKVTGKFALFRLSLLDQRGTIRRFAAALPFIFNLGGSHEDHLEIVTLVDFAASPAPHYWRKAIHFSVLGNAISLKSKSYAMPLPKSLTRTVEKTSDTASNTPRKSAHPPSLPRESAQTASPRTLSSSTTNNNRAGHLPLTHLL
jgi:hypothetical protein